MPLRVYSFCAYFTPDPGGDGPQWADVKAQGKQDIYHATKFVKAVKGHTITGFADIPVRQRSGTLVHRRLEDSNRDQVFGWFAEMVAGEYQFDSSECVHLVPAPGSSCTTQAKVAAGPTARLCAEIERVIPWCDTRVLLWWTQRMQSARKGGGTRNAAFKYKNLVVPTVPKGLVGPDHVWMLVDDNVSTGGTLRAMAKRLREQGVTPDYGVCVSRTTHSIEAAFELRDDEYADL